MDGTDGNLTNGPTFICAGLGCGTNHYEAGDYRLRPESACVDAGTNQALARSVRNLAGSDFLPVDGLNVYDILRHDALVLTAATAKKLEEVLS